MKIRLTTISLTHDGKRFEEGEVVETGAKKGQVPEDVAQARLDAGTAELVEEGKAPAKDAQ
jgi:hypothetical protein